MNIPQRIALALLAVGLWTLAEVFHGWLGVAALLVGAGLTIWALIPTRE